MSRWLCGEWAGGGGGGDPQDYTVISWDWGYLSNPSRLTIVIMKVKCRNILIFPICGLLSPIKAWVWDDRDQFLLSMAPSVTEWRQYFPCPNLVLITIDHDLSPENKKKQFQFIQNPNPNKKCIWISAKWLMTFFICLLLITKPKVHINEAEESNNFLLVHRIMECIILHCWGSQPFLKANRS